MRDDLTILGDVHLGKKFVTGVPKHRVGEREVSVWKDFENSVINCTTKYHVQVGDLFEAFIVPPEVVLRAYEAYAVGNPNTLYFVLRGNHDASRDTNKASSFDLFTQMCEHLGNVIVIKDEVVQYSPFAFIPWHPFNSAAEQAKQLAGKQYEIVFGHFDLESFGGSDHNLIPTKELVGVTPRIVTGHIHTPKVFEQDGIEVVVTGSMQPYSHGEDPEHKLYVSLTLDELKGQDLSNMNVRILLKEGEEMPEIDCLSLTFKKIDQEEPDDVGDIEVEFEDFNIENLFTSCLKDNQVGGSIADQINAKFRELKNA